jgi:hypothetical protein
VRWSHPPRPPSMSSWQPPPLETDMPTNPESYFIRTGVNTFRPTGLTSGAWSPAEQHFSPMGGLIAHAVDVFVADRGADDMLLGRISFDILGVVRLEEFELHVDVIRPGRTIEILEVVVIAQGRPAVRARAWRLSRHDTAMVAGGATEALPSPEGLASWPLTSVWPGGYIASLDVRPVGSPQPGRTTAWISTPAPLVADEPVRDVARFVGLVDTANGIAVRQSPKKWMFPNVDLTIHLFRQPEGAWAGLDTSVVFGEHGQGLTSTNLHDLQGPVGKAEQILTIRPLT